VTADTEVAGGASNVAASPLTTTSGSRQGGWWRTWT
jgi:hypothetical protein